MPYGTKLLTTLGAPNYITGDFNGDGIVDAADYTVWRDSVGEVGTEFAHPAADANHDFMVDQADYEIWRANYGAPYGVNPPGVAQPAAAPEPTAIWLSAGCLSAGFTRRRCFRGGR